MANSQCGEPGFTVSGNAHRFFVWTGGNGYQDGGMTLDSPAAGGDVDGPCIDGVASTVAYAGYGAYYAIPGMPFRIEAGAAINAGALLEADSLSRAVPQSTGIAVARALQAAAGAGTIIGAVFTFGR